MSVKDYTGTSYGVIIDSVVREFFSIKKSKAGPCLASTLKWHVSSQSRIRDTDFKNIDIFLEIVSLQVFNGSDEDTPI